MLASNCDKYVTIFDGLSKNFTLLKGKMGTKVYDDYFNSDENKFIKDSEEYNNAINRFYLTEKDVIDCLLTYEDNNDSMSSWISTRFPLSSNIQVHDYYKESEAALILIDNYLSNDEKSIVVRPYVKKMTYSGFKLFYGKYKNLRKNDIKKEYRNFIKTL